MNANATQSGNIPLKASKDSAQNRYPLSTILAPPEQSRGPAEAEAVISSTDDKMTLDDTTLLGGEEYDNSQEPELPVNVWCKAHRGKVKFVAVWLTRGGNVDARCAFGTLLCAAAAGGQEAMVRMLLQRGASGVNLQDTNGNNALMQAAAHGRSAVMQMLLAAKADASLQTTDDSTALVMGAGLQSQAAADQFRTEHTRMAKLLQHHTAKLLQHTAKLLQQDAKRLKAKAEVAVEVKVEIMKHDNQQKRLARRLRRVAAAAAREHNKETLAVQRCVGNCVANAVAGVLARTRAEVREREAFAQKAAEAEERLEEERYGERLAVLRALNRAPAERREKALAAQSKLRSKPAPTRAPRATPAPAPPRSQPAPPPPPSKRRHRRPTGMRPKVAARQLQAAWRGVLGRRAAAAHAADPVTRQARARVMCASLAAHVTREALAATSLQARIKGWLARLHLPTPKPASDSEAKKAAADAAAERAQAEADAVEHAAVEQAAADARAIEEGVAQSVASHEADEQRRAAIQAALKVIQGLDEKWVLAQLEAMVVAAGTSTAAYAAACSTSSAVEEARLCTICEAVPREVRFACGLATVCNTCLPVVVGSPL